MKEVKQKLTSLYVYQHYMGFGWVVATPLPHGSAKHSFRTASLGLMQKALTDYVRMT